MGDVLAASAVIGADPDRPALCRHARASHRHEVPYPGRAVRREIETFHLEGEQA